MSLLLFISQVISELYVLSCQVASVMSDSATPQSVACQAPLSMGLSRQEYWNGLPGPPPGN